MVKIVGVRFRSSGKTYYFDPGEFELRAGMNVIVETVRGMEYGTIAGTLREVEEEEISQPLRPILRIATEEDTERAARNREKEKEAMSICREKIRKHGLEMKLIDAEYTFDNNKILFYFTADGRIDFRELVKDLASVFRTRIELRQIGVRDETKILGGIGICGRPLCCHTYLSDFVPVSIKMAKEQNLSLNPTKISGVCGRLMCCLKNEEDTYEYLNSKLPGIGDTVTTPTGLQGEVASVSVLRQKVKVMVEVDDEKEIHEYDVDELRFRPRKKKDKKEKGDQAQKEHGEKQYSGNEPGDTPKADKEPEENQHGGKAHSEKKRADRQNSDKPGNERQKGEKRRGDRERQPEERRRDRRQEDAEQRPEERRRDRRQEDAEQRPEERRRDRRQEDAEQRPEERRRERRRDDAEQKAGEQAEDRMSRDRAGEGVKANGDTEMLPEAEGVRGEKRRPRRRHRSHGQKQQPDGAQTAGPDGQGTADGVGGNAGSDVPAAVKSAVSGGEE